MTHFIIIEISKSLIDNKFLFKMIITNFMSISATSIQQLFPNDYQHLQNKHAKNIYRGLNLLGSSKWILSSNHKFNINGVIATINIINKAIINIFIFIFVSSTLSSSFFLNIDNLLCEKGRQIGAVALSQISEARPSIVEAEPCELSHQTRF